jgi:hypothetical protein
MTRLFKSAAGRGLTEATLHEPLYLEDTATDIQVQGLKLDWTIGTWDADLRWRGSDWSFHSFRGAKWTDAKKP